MPELMRTPTQMAFKLQEVEERVNHLNEQVFILKTKIKNLQEKDGKKTKKTK